jgi:hypothetical protein
LITNVVTTEATVPYAAMTAPIHQQLADKALLPGEHLVDSGYPSAELVMQAARLHRLTLVSPLLLDHSAQARAGAGYDKAAFTFDFDARQATCPQHVPSSTWTTCTQRGDEAIVVSWAKTACGPCPVRELCTSGRRRQITIRSQQLHEALADARTEQTTTQWKARYAARAGVEGTMRQTRQRHPPGPLPRLTQDRTGTQHRRHRDQRDPPGRLVDRPPAGPHTIKPPRTARLHRGLTELASSHCRPGGRPIPG